MIRDYRVDSASFKGEYDRYTKKKVLPVTESNGLDGIEALSVVLEHVSTRRCEDDQPAPLEWLKGQFPFDAVVYRSIQGSGADKTASTNHARCVLRVLEQAHETVNQHHTHLSMLYKYTKEKVNACILRRGFESLPDNILSDVLELATRPEPTKPKPMEPGLPVDVAAEMQSLRKAHSLSHVCQYFRSLILDRARVWNIISDDMRDIENVKFCTRFSKQAPMAIFLEHFGLQYMGKFESFFEACLLSSDRWGSLTIGANDYHPHDGLQPSQRWPEVSRNIASIGRLSETLELPELQYLAILFNNTPSPTELNAQHLPFWLWSIPNLVGLELSGCHPPPPNLSFSRTLKEFKLILRNVPGQDFQTTQLAEFLSDCKTLEYVSINLNDWVAIAPASGTPISIVSVQQVEFSFCYCRPAAGIALCSSIHFPNATDMSLSLRDLILDRHDEVGVWSIESLVRECISRHPRLEILEFSFRQNRIPLTPIAPPITLLPALKELTLKFHRWRDLQFWTEGPSARLRLPAIRRLTMVTTCLVICWHSVRIWAEKFFAQLKKQENLDSFRRFQITQTDKKTRPPPRIEGEIFDYVSGEKFILSWAV